MTFVNGTSSCLIFPWHVETSLKLQRRKFFPAGISNVRVITCQFIALKRWPLPAHHFFFPQRPLQTVAIKRLVNPARISVVGLSGSSRGFSVVRYIHAQHNNGRRNTALQIFIANVISRPWEQIATRYKAAISCNSFFMGLNLRLPL